MQPNWDDFRIFLAVSRAESLSEAGRRLRIDPATVGRRIARLEEAIGAPLFAKSPTGYAMTDAGQRLMGHALRAEAAMMDAGAELTGTEGGLSGQIRIGAPDGCANFLLPQVCAQISDDHPDLEIQIVALPRVVNLSKREADIAIAVSPPSAGRMSVQKVTDYHLHLAATREYIEKNGPFATVDDLRGHRVIGYIPDMIFDKELDYLSELGMERVTLASNSVSVQFHWVRQGCGFGIVHDFAIPNAPEVQKILPQALSLRRSFYLIRHDDDRRLDRMNKFSAALADGLRKEVARLEGLS